MNALCGYKNEKFIFENGISNNNNGGIITKENYTFVLVYNGI